MSDKPRLIDHLPDLICTYLPDTTLVDVNDAYAQYFGQDKQSIIGKPFLNFVPEEFHEDILTKIRSMSADMPQSDYEHEVLGADGNTYWQYWSDRAVFDDNGSLLKIHAIGRDITQLNQDRERYRKKQLELAETNDLLELVLDNVPSRIWLKDDKNTIIRLNRSAAQSMGGTVSQFEGRNTFDLFGPMAQKYLDDDLETIGNGSPMLGIIEEYEPNEGERGWVTTDKIPVKASGESDEKRLLVVSTDITTTIQNQKKLEETNKNLSQFASMASHDLKAPLRRMKVFAELMQLEAGSQINPEVKKLIEVIDTNCSEMRCMIDAFLKFAKSLPEDIKFEKTDIIDLLHQYKNGIADELEQAGGQMNIQTGKFEIHTSKDLVIRVIDNLVQNSIKYRCPERPLMIDISLTHRIGGVIRADIRDNGSGINDEQRDCIFDFFQRGKNASDETGFGLGLAICRRIMTQLGGAIELGESSPNGSKFQLTIPIGGKNSR